MQDLDLLHTTGGSSVRAFASINGENVHHVSVFIEILSGDEPMRRGQEMQRLGSQEVDVAALRPRLQAFLDNLDPYFAKVDRLAQTVGASSSQVIAVNAAAISDSIGEPLGAVDHERVPPTLVERRLQGGGELLDLGNVLRNTGATSNINQCAQSNESKPTGQNVTGGRKSDNGPGRNTSGDSSNSRGLGDDSSPGGSNDPGDDDKKSSKRGPRNSPEAKREGLKCPLYACRDDARKDYLCEKRSTDMIGLL